MVSRKVLKGRPFTMPRALPSSSLQRKMLNSVQTNFQPDASDAAACIVHLHGEERTALAVAKELRSRRCVNLVHLDTTQRYVGFEVEVAGKTHRCDADPNRVFSDAGLQKYALKDKGCHLVGGNATLRTDKQPDVKAAAVAELKAFTDGEWGQKISECRGGSGPSVTDGTLPVLALHNNELSSNKTSLIEDYRKAAEKGDRLPDDPKAPKKKMPNPSFKAGEGTNDFLLVTDPKDYKGLSATRTVLLQADPVPTDAEDGSLSVALSGKEFINVEKQGRRHDQLVGKEFKAHDKVYVKNYEMAAEALDQLGVPEGMCLPSFLKSLIKSSPSVEKVLSGEESPAETALDLLLGETTKNSPPATVLSTDQPVLDRDPVPEKKPKGCLFFENLSELDARKSVWTQKIDRLPLLDAVNWIIGAPGTLPAGVETEVQSQRECMTAAMTATLKAKGLKLPGGKIVKSERRTYTEQEQGIWKPKFAFDKSKGKFGHISDEARKKCSGIKPTETEWDTSNKVHQDCWSKTLSGQEREKEILMTSAVPGVSRHHAGTDFDFGRTEKDLEPEVWTGTGDFADAYRWLARNASRYGFIQPFDTKGGYGKGYMTERWHWSYYPIAQALLEFARLHQNEIDKALQEHWSDKSGAKAKSEYQFISQNWRDYLFNVETQPRF